MERARLCSSRPEGFESAWEARRLLRKGDCSPGVPDVAPTKRDVMTSLLKAGVPNAEILLLPKDSGEWVCGVANADIEDI
jgi:hypothetical protein